MLTKSVNSQSNKNYNILTKTVVRLLLLLLAFVVSCGGDSAGTTADTVDPRTIYSGFIIDSAVEGLGYDCGNSVISTNGRTDSTGRFYYPTSGTCTLSVGQVKIAAFNPTNTADLSYTPFDIWADDAAALNAARFLQTLDGSGTLDDGIQIPATLANVTGTIDLSKDLASAADNPGVTAVLTALGKTTANLVTESAAQNHLYGTIIQQAIDQVSISHYNDADIALPAEVTVNTATVTKKVAITWGSDNASCVVNDGTLGTAKPCLAGLTGTFKLGGVTKTKSWTAYVGNKTKVGPLELYGEYITQHVYFVNAIAAEDMDEEITFVVSTNSTAPALSSIDAQAKVVRRFKSGDADLSVRPIYLAWDAGLKEDTYKTFLNGLNKTAYNASTHNWLLKTDTKYNLYLYKGAETFSHEFTTLGYKSTIKEYASALLGARDQVLFNTGIDRVSVKGYVERKENEPVMYSTFFGPGYDPSTNLDFFTGGLMGGCSSGGCDPGMTLLIFNPGGLFPSTSNILGVSQADMMMFAGRTYKDGNLVPLASSLVMKAEQSGVASSMTYKTVTE